MKTLVRACLVAVATRVRGLGPAGGLAWVAALLLIAAGTGCDDEPADPCGTIALPLSGGTNTPVVTDVGLEVQGSGIVIVATVTDPQGDSDLLHIPQSIGIFPDDRCSGTPILLQDDIAYSGVEETFGTVVEASENRALYDAIAASDGWPAVVDVVDAGGHRTTGRVRARIIH
jgi:hypothetical protein